MEESGRDTCSFHTNWPILDGDLQSCITIESSASPDDDTPVSTPLLLQRPSPDSDPCEIKIVFAQKHQVRQIYIRSTSRIYEVYYAHKVRSTNEYLCTVRCSQVEVSPDHENEAARSAFGSESQMAAETSSARSSNTSANEDGWVAVKSTGSNADKNSDDVGRMEEDLYEATAEISDGDSCISLTLRLLSVQSKGYVYVNEVYVFADPVEADDLEEQLNPMGNMVGSSLMAMLAPSLYQLQLTKPSISKAQNKCPIEEQRNQNTQDLGSQGDILISATNENPADNTVLAGNQQPTKFPSSCAPASYSEPVHPHIPTRTPDVGVDSDPVPREHPQVSSRIEQVLDQLVSRMSKLEDICSRFKENIQKPIVSIEDRLLQVEHQLSVLTKNSQNIKIPSGTRFSAPDWSCVESGSSSSDVDEKNPIVGSSSILDIPSGTSPTHSSGNASPVSVDNTELPQDHVSTTGLEVANQDSKQKEVDPPIPGNEVPTEPQKKRVSIDDALASALAAFVSPLQPYNITTAFAITAPEFSCSEECENDIADSSCDRAAPMTSSVVHGELEEAECEMGSKSISNSFAPQVQESVDNVSSADKLEEQNHGCSLDEAGGDLQILSDVHGRGDEKPVLNSTNRVSASLGYTFEEDIGSHCKESSLTGIEPDDCNYNPLWAANEKEATKQEALRDVFGLSSIPSPLNFETPILDVTFASGKICCAKSSPLEALITDMALGLEVKASHGAELANENGFTNEHDDLIFVSHDETSNCTSSDFALNTLYLEPQTSIVKDEGQGDEAAEDFCLPCNHETFPVSLI